MYEQGMIPWVLRLPLPGSAGRRAKRSGSARERLPGDPPCSMEEQGLLSEIVRSWSGRGAVLGQGRWLDRHKYHWPAHGALPRPWLEGRMNLRSLVLRSHGQKERAV